MYGGHDGRTGGVWLWPSAEHDGVVGQLSVGRGRLRRLRPVAGMIDPETHLPTATASTSTSGVAVWRTEPRAIFRYETNAGGGWGDPLEREPERVMRDVRDGYVSIEGAARDYGVVVAATRLGSGGPGHRPRGDRELRASMRARR